MKNKHDQNLCWQYIVDISEAMADKVNKLSIRYNERLKDWAKEEVYALDDAMRYKQRTIFENEIIYISSMDLVIKKTLRPLVDLLN